MQKKFVSSLLLLLLLNVLVKPFWILGIDLTVQNRVGETEYGLYAAIFSFGLIFNILLDLGITHYNNRSIAIDRSQVVKNFSNLTAIKLFLGLLYLMVSLVLGFVLGYTSDAFQLLLLLTCSQFLASYILFLRSNLAGLHLFKSDAVLSVLDKLLMIISCGILLYTPVLGDSFSIIHFAWAQLGSYALAALIGFLLVLKEAKVFKLNIDFHSFVKNLKKSIPYALLILLMALYTRVDSVMIQQISGSFENGVYFQGFRLLDVINQFGYLVGLLLLPIFSGMIARNENVSNLSQLAFSLVFIGVLAVALPCWLMAEDILSFLYVENSRLSAPVFKVLLLSTIPFATTYIFGTMLTAKGSMKVLNVVAFLGFVLNVVLNFWLIPLYGAWGAAIATVTTQCVSTIGQVILSFRFCSLSYSANYWLRLFGFVATSILASFIIITIDISLPVFLVLSFVTTVILSLLFKLLDTRAALQLVKSRFK